jgi:hypothetical protein
MTMSRWSFAAVVVGVFLAGFAARSLFSPTVLHAQTDKRVFEVRTYTAAPGKMENLKARFRDAAVPGFKRHGLVPLAGFWVPMDPPLNENTIIYVLVHESREAAKKNWSEFQADPEWVKARAASVADGPITTSVQSVYVAATDFAPAK